MTVIRHPNNQGVTLSQWRKTAAGGETSVSGTDDFSAGLAYTAGAEQVFVNGVLLERGVDYTASTGTTVTGLTALVAGDIVTVSSPSAFNVANAIPKATITAKGDLLVGTGASTPTNLGVGADGQTLVADSSTSTGLRYTAGIGIAQPIINGGADIWQRGTTFTVASNYSTYTLDRFIAYRGGLNAGGTLSRQSTNDTTNLPFIQYCIRYQRDSGNTATGDLTLLYGIETANSIPYAGKQITFSFYARAGANYSATSNLLQVRVDSGTGTDQSIGSGYTGQTSVIYSSATLTTTWQRFTFTGTVASTAKELGFYLFGSPTGTAGANDYYETTGFQIDFGAVALPFRRSGGTLQGELAAAQRYYFRMPASGAYTAIGQGAAYSTTAVAAYFPFASTMRVAPTSLDFSTLAVQDIGSGGFTAITGATTNAPGTTGSQVNLTGASGLTQFRPYIVSTNNSTSGYLGFSAEL